MNMAWSTGMVITANNQSMIGNTWEELLTFIKRQEGATIIVKLNYIYGLMHKTRPGTITMPRK